RLGQAQLAGRDQIEPEGGEKLAEFGELAGIMGGDAETGAGAEAGDGVHLLPPSRARWISFQMGQIRSEKTPSPGPAGRPLPQRERWRCRAGRAPLTSPRGERSPAGEGAFLL